LVGEAAAFGVPHPVLGQAIVIVVTPRHGVLDKDNLLAECRQRLPAYMIPTEVCVRAGPLPRNQNGKIDRKILSGEFQGLFEEASSCTPRCQSMLRSVPFRLRKIASSSAVCR